MKKSDLYYTYNPVKREFLKEKGVRYFIQGTHNTTGRSFWTYIRDNKLDQALIEWRKYQEERFEN